MSRPRIPDEFQHLPTPWHRRWARCDRDGKCRTCSKALAPGQTKLCPDCRKKLYESQVACRRRKRAAAVKAPTLTLDDVI